MDDEQQIRGLITTWMRASKAGDTATVLSLMADDVIFLMAGQPPMRGKSGFASAQAGLDQFDIESDSSVEEIQIQGDWAYCWTTLRVTITPRQGGGSAVTRAGNTLSIFKKVDGTWLLFRDANLLAPTS